METLTGGGVGLFGGGGGGGGVGSLGGGGGVGSCKGVGDFGGVGDGGLGSLGSGGGDIDGRGGFSIKPGSPLLPRRESSDSRRFFTERRRAGPGSSTATLIATKLMILIVNSSFSTGGRVLTTPGFTFSGLSFFSFSIFADFEPSVFFFTDAFLFSGSSTGAATDFGALLLFLRANLTCT